MLHIACRVTFGESPVRFNHTLLVVLPAAIAVAVENQEKVESFDASGEPKNSGVLLSVLFTLLPPSSCDAHARRDEGGGRRRHAARLRLFHQASTIVTPLICCCVVTYAALLPAAFQCGNTDISWPAGKLSQDCMDI